MAGDSITRFLFAALLRLLADDGKTSVHQATNVCCSHQIDSEIQRMSFFAFHVVCLSVQSDYAMKCLQSFCDVTRLTHAYTHAKGS